MTNAGGSVVTDEMRAQIGVESDAWTVEVDRTAIRMFARSVQYTDPLFYDEAFAKEKGYRALPAPPHYLGTPIYNPDAPPRGARQLNVPYRRNLNGGTEIEYFDTIVAGDVLSATSKLTDLEETSGRLGPMLIIRSETTYRRDGEVVAVARGTGIRY
jgi:acyl dehydratase